MKKLIVAMLIGMFAFAGAGEKIFGFEKSAQAKIVLGGAAMQQHHFDLMKGFIYEAVIKGNFSEEMKAKCAEMLVWATKKLVDKRYHDLSTTTDDLSRLFRAVVGDINTFFSNPKTKDKDRTAAAKKWIDVGKRIAVRFVKITIKSSTTGKEETKIDWEITLTPKAKVETKGKKKK
jgi:hypothetical protein